MLKILSNIDYPKELIKAILESKVGAYGANLFGPIIYTSVMSSRLSTSMLEIWLLLHLIIFVIRITIANKALKNFDLYDKKTMNRYLKYYLTTIFSNSLLWGLVSIFVIVDSSEVDFCAGVYER